jgi:hypothetical protein
MHEEHFMSYWMWLNLSLAAVFFAGIVGIPLWMVLRHPETGPQATTAPAQAHAWKRYWAAQRVRSTADRQAAAAASPRTARQRVRAEFELD